MAASIPDPTLRGYATHAILVDSGNAEAVAALAATAPRRQCQATVELLVAYQVLVDYVDILGEQACADNFDRSLELGMALVAAIDAPMSPLRIDPLGDDGGYLFALVTSCRTRFWNMPSASAVDREAEAAAVRCAQALAYTHTATPREATAELRRWTMTQEGATDYSWWETAAGANSNLAILALLAAAAGPHTTQRNVTAIASAYWPHVCVLSTLFDSLVDYERDRASGGFSFVSHYPDAAATQEGLIHATRRSLTAVKPLRGSHTHTMIVYGVVAYYAASAGPGSLAAHVAPSVIAQLGPAATPIVLALRARYRFGGMQTR